MDEHRRIFGADERPPSCGTLGSPFLNDDAESLVREFGTLAVGDVVTLRDELRPAQVSRILPVELPEHDYTRMESIASQRPNCRSRNTTTQTMTTT